MVTINKQKCILQLSNKKTHLDDECVNNVIKFIHSITQERSGHMIILADSLHVEQFVIDDVKRKKYFIATMKTRHPPSKVNRIYIIPVHSNDHWSLLVRMPKIKCWFHFDSIPGYHRSYASRLANKIDTEIYEIDEDDEENEFDFIYFKNVPQQNSNWECGIYLLMYVFVMIHYTTIYNYDENDDDETIKTDIFNYMRIHLKQLDNRKCMVFAASIVERLRM